MLSELVLGDVVVVCRQEAPEYLSSCFRNAKLVFLNDREKIRLKNYEQIKVPRSEPISNIFLDLEDRNLYLTNFVLDQNLLEIPVKAIAVFENKIAIFIGNKSLLFDPDRFGDGIQDAQFFKDIFHKGKVQDVQMNIQNKRTTKKYYEESAITYSDYSNSGELGVFTIEEYLSVDRVAQNFEKNLGSDDIDGANSSTNTSVQNMPIGFEKDCLNEIYEPTENPGKIVPVKPIPISALDSRKVREIEILRYMQKVDELLNGLTVNQKEVMVSADQITLSRNFATSDSTVRKMKNHLAKHSELPHPDPIIVVKQNENLQVVSGNRRVSAYKAMSRNKIWVSEIDSEDFLKFRLNSYFGSNVDADHELIVMKNIIKDLLSYLNISNSMLKTWTAIEKNRVFGKLFQSKMKLRHLLDIYPHERLMETLMKLSSDGLKFNGYSLRDIGRKYRKNPKSTNSALEAVTTDVELKNAISKLRPDVKFLLEEKNVPEDVAQELSIIYEDDLEFLNFARSSDLRCINRATPLSAVTDKFHVFLNKKKTSPPCSKTNFIVSNISDTEFDILLTANHEFALQATKIKESIFILSVGSLLSNSDHILLLPDQMGIEDCNGKLNNYVSLEIIIKVDGEILQGRAKTTFLSRCGITNRIIYTTDQLFGLSQEHKTYYIDFGGLISEELAKLLIPPDATIVVKTANQQQKLQKYFTRRVTESLTIAPTR
ncbi:hypothetical protein GCK72_022883 [Caenorhabditis remanei]|uniref:ParB/Sulfiredoxin domain-containing protein n=1 Tax=Caenorhabditis remanei TaxID=31234 RepID=A0A6A5FUY7_CAERE|nr:hypothetical protein GCK72_022883 [Caenorhabditis remanei]KAF1746428.1 hypothetical protein GCK72_022883 [Caenorhabditis remanei]